MDEIVADARSRERISAVLIAGLALGPLLLGVPGIYMSGHALCGFLIGVSPFDIPTLVSVATGLSAIALLVCYLAARRVSTIEPDRLLREGG